MSQYAHVHDGNVLQVIEADAAHIAERPEPDVGKWVSVPEDQLADIGGTYNDSANRFINPKPYNSWVLNGEYEWVPPIPYPADYATTNKIIEWDEETTSWIETGTMPPPP
tara:strand:+ start:221 stop:550 length:330 start_codon:yes stop_codon:yes gene_type:complete